MNRDGTWKYRFSLKQMEYALLILFVVSMIPLVLIGFYNYPSEDDFSMGISSWFVFCSGGSPLAVFRAAVERAIWYYFNWMGYFTSSILMSFPPSVFGENCYRFASLIVFTVFIFSYIYFLHALFRKLLNMEKRVSICLSVLILFVSIQCMPEGMARVEAFFWYCSAANYTIMYSAALVYFGLLISWFTDRSRGKRIYDYIMSVILGFFVGGGNYLSALSAAIISGLLILTVCVGKHFFRLETVQRITVDVPLAVYIRKADKKQMLQLRLIIIPCVSELIGFLLSCTAPGNAQRAGLLEGMGAVKTVFVSLYYTLVYPVGMWTGFAVLLLLLIAFPFWWIEAERIAERISFRFPFLFLLFAYGFTSANICPSLYAESSISAGRLQELFWLQYILMLFFSEGYIAGWLKKSLNRLDVSVKRTAVEKNRRFSPFFSGIIVSAVILLAFGSCLYVKADPDFYAATSAAQDLLNGHAAYYAAQNIDRQQILHDPEVTDAVLEYYEYEPDLLYYADVAPVGMEDNWSNQAIARYYGKNSVARTERSSGHGSEE